jgi:hypothetical protein
MLYSTMRRARTPLPSRHSERRGDSFSSRPRLRGRVASQSKNPSSRLLALKTPVPHTSVLRVWTLGPIAAIIAAAKDLVSMLSDPTKKSAHLIESTEHQATCFHIHAHTFPGSPVDSAFYELGTGGIVGSDCEPASKSLHRPKAVSHGGADIVVMRKKLPKYVAAAFRPPS